MPVIEPIIKEGTIVRTVDTTKASDKFREAITPKTQEEPKKEGELKTDLKDIRTEEPKNNDRLLKARLVQEGLKRQLEAERKKLEEERKQLEIERAGSRKWQEADELIKAGRYIEAADKVGLTYDQLTQQILNGGNVPPAKIAQETAETSVSKALEEFKKQLKEESIAAQQKQYTETLTQIGKEVEYIAKASDKFPLVKQSESYEDVVKLIESEFHRTGRIIPVEEALTRWEEEALTGLEELFKLEPVRTKLIKEPQTKPKEEAVVPQTLTQKNTVNTPAPKPMTDAERKQRAIDAFYGRLT